jgi:hypothetical protein
MNEFIYLLGEVVFLIVFIILFISGFSYYFNILKYIYKSKINHINKKYTVVDINEYMKFLGKCNLFVSLICLLSFYILVFKKHYVFPYLWILSMILLITSKISEIHKNKFLRKK